MAGYVPVKKIGVECTWFIFLYWQAKRALSGELDIGKQSEPSQGSWILASKASPLRGVGFKTTRKNMNGSPS